MSASHSAAASRSDARPDASAASLLAEAVSDFLQAGAANAPRSADSFRRAYSTLVNSVPKAPRRALYQVMGEALAAVAEKEGLDDAPGADGADANRAFMDELRRQERSLRQQDIAAQRLLGSADM